MKTIKYIKSTIIATVAGALLLLPSCDLELTPIDNYGSNSFWIKESHFDGFMVGLRSDLRNASWQHSYVLGEARGGSSKIGTSVTGESLDYGAVKNQALRADQTGIINWGDIYGKIANINVFIQNTENTTILTDEKRKILLAQAYGMRAFYYFDLYRTYGGCPLQLENKILNGTTQPELLYTARSKPSEIMAQIKLDLKNSNEYFGENRSFAGKKSTWSKAATEALMADVYLWTAKVTTGDDTANPADISIAKQHLLNLTNDYSLALLPKFSEIYNPQPDKKGHEEAIMAIRYTEGEATNSNNQFIYSMLTNFKGNWAYEDGSITETDTLQVGTTGILRNEYKKGLFFLYDKEDSRRDATFLSVYSKTTKEYAGSFTRKNIGYFNSTTGSRVYCGDMLWYRLGWVYLALAEVENFEGGDPAKYINIIRKRAYADNWDETKHAYVNSDFKTNELAILKEKDREMVQEGQRWWDVRRMSESKGGRHLVFVAEANIDSNTPILDEKTEAHKVLWPIEVNMLNKDPLLEQTPGY